MRIRAGLIRGVPTKERLLPQVLWTENANPNQGGSKERGGVWD
jgi:hypothetical protein